MRPACDAVARHRHVAHGVVGDAHRPLLQREGEGPLRPVDEDALALGLNVGGKMLDFGPLVTDGAFRLLHPKRGAWQLFADKPAWQLIPLPGSKPFRAEIRLAAFGEGKAQVKTIEKVDSFDAAAKNPLWIQDGDVLHLECDGRSFAYRIVFE